MSIDRTIAPPFGRIDKVDFVKHKEFKLDNGIPVYIVSAGNEEISRIELLFDAGDYRSGKAMVASTTNSMLNEGTKQHTGLELSEKIDYYGAFLETDAQQDFAYINLYSLNKHLENVLPYYHEIVMESAFPQKEFETQMLNKKQSWTVNQEKVGYICRTNFYKYLFGTNHPYATVTKEEDFSSLTKEELISFYNANYKADSCRIIVSGKIDDGMLGLLNRYFGSKDWASGTKSPVFSSDLIYPDTKKNFIEKEDAIQNAIRIGKRLFTKTHKDYIPMIVLNTVLGGYFGSRLMTNIREEKGYTYGIGSGVASLLHEGMFVISTEVGAEVCSAALEEIYKEINLLRTELIDEEELDLVKNYLLGAHLKSLDGPFAIADKFKGIMVYGLDYSYYDLFLDTVKNITSERLLELAKTYLDPDSLFELVVGKKV